LIRQRVDFGLRMKRLVVGETIFGGSSGGEALARHGFVVVRFGGGFFVAAEFEHGLWRSLVGEDGIVVGCDCPKSRAETIIIYE
jgi:hypothetical protein